MAGAAAKRYIPPFAAMRKAVSRKAKTSAGRFLRIAAGPAKKKVKAGQGDRGDRKPVNSEARKKSSARK